MLVLELELVPVDHEAREQEFVLDDSKEAAEQGRYATVSLEAGPSGDGGDNSNTQREEHVAPKTPRFHPQRIKMALFCALGLTIVNTVLVVQILPACNMGLACVFSCIWGFLLSYCWNSFSMLRVSLVPGGRESEFAGLYLALYSSMIWLPLLVFSVANELWSIDGALYVLTAFFGVGALVLLLVNIERGLASREGTLSLRRWAHLAHQPKTGAAAAPAVDGTALEKPAIDCACSEAGTVDHSSAAGGSSRLDDTAAASSRWRLW